MWKHGKTFQCGKPSTYYITYYAHTVWIRTANSFQLCVWQSLRWESDFMWFPLVFSIGIKLKNRQKKLNIASHSCPRSCHKLVCSLKLHALRMERIAFFSWSCGLVTSEPSSILNLDNPSNSRWYQLYRIIYNRFSKLYTEYIFKTCLLHPSKYAHLLRKWSTVSTPQQVMTQ